MPIASTAAWRASLAASQAARRKWNRAPKVSPASPNAVARSPSRSPRHRPQASANVQTGCGRDASTRRLDQGDFEPGRALRIGVGPGQGGGIPYRGADARAVGFRRTDWYGGPTDPGDREPDQSAGPQCHDRVGARRRCRQGLCRGRQRSEGLANPRRRAPPRISRFLSPRSRARPDSPSPRSARSAKPSPR